MTSIKKPFYPVNSTQPIVNHDKKINNEIKNMYPDLYYLKLYDAHFHVSIAQILTQSEIDL